MREILDNILMTGFGYGLAPMKFNERKRIVDQALVQMKSELLGKIDKTIDKKLINAEMITSQIKQIIGEECK